MSSPSTAGSKVVSIRAGTKPSPARTSNKSSTAGKVRQPVSGGLPPDGGVMVDIGKLQTHVRWIERGLAGLAVAAGVAFLYLLGQIGGNFEKSDARLRTVETTLSAQTESLKAIDQRLSSIERKLEERPTAQPTPSEVAKPPR